jgi:RNA polymerase sporulation-specific sigma factor
MTRLGHTRSVRAAALGAEHDARLTAAAQRGEEAALQALAERYRPLVQARARGFFLDGADRDDVVQEAMIGLLNAALGYDPSLGLSFRAFATVCVRRRLVSALRASKRGKHAPLRGYAALDERSVAACHDMPRGDPAETVTRAVTLRQALAETAGSLTALEADVLRRVVSGMSYEQVASSLGRDGKCVDNALQRARRKLRTRLTAHDAG